MDTLLVVNNIATWWTAVSNELELLSNGFNFRVRATNTINFISKYKLPSVRKFTYENFVCDHWPLKLKNHLVQLTMGAYELYCLDENEFPGAYPLEIKILLNSIIYDACRGARFLSWDLFFFP